MATVTYVVRGKESVLLHATAKDIAILAKRANVVNVKISADIKAGDLTKIEKLGILRNPVGVSPMD